MSHTMYFPDERITNHNQVFLYWTLITYFIVFTGNQSILRDVTGDLVCIPIKIKKCLLHSLLCDQPKGHRVKRLYRLHINEGLCRNLSQVQAVTGIQEYIGIHLEQRRN